jgi:hypothetical protein
LELKSRARGWLYNQAKPESINTAQDTHSLGCCSEFQVWGVALNWFLEHPLSFGIISINNCQIHDLLPISHSTDR